MNSRVAPASPHSAGRFTPAPFIVTSWRQGRVCLAGDAPPDAAFMGQGFNSGIRDAGQASLAPGLLGQGRGRFAVRRLHRGTSRRSCRCLEQTVAIAGCSA